MTSSAITAAWLVRAGKHGEREEKALTEGLVIAGWEELGDISDRHSKEDLRVLIAQTYPEDGKARIANWTGQLWRFLAVIQVGDHVVLPLKSRPAIAIGVVIGPYEYRGDAPEGWRHIRRVRWLRTDIPREAVKQDLLDSMGSLLTVCGLSRFEADRRIAYLAEHGSDPGPGHDGEPDGLESAVRSDLLAEAAGRDPADPIRLSIRAFLGRWGASRRTSSVVATIEADLAEKGLTTRPPFTEGWIDNLIELVPLGEEPIAGQTSFGSQVAEDTQDVSELPPVTLRVGDLEAANNGVESVTPDQPLLIAMTKMIANDYSQLGVIGDDGTFYGAVSWESIGRAHMADPAATLADATVPTPVLEYGELLLDQIEQIYTRGFVFVRSTDKTRISGIISTADLTLQFGDLARPFVLIEEAERRLRRRVDEVFTLDEIQAQAQRRPEFVQSASALTLGNYWFLLEPGERFRKLGWNVDHRIFLGLLKAVNEIRNETMHFSPDPLTKEQLAQLNGFLSLLRAVDPKP